MLLGRSVRLGDLEAVVNEITPDPYLEDLGFGEYEFFTRTGAGLGVDVDNDSIQIYTPRDAPTILEGVEPFSYFFYFDGDIQISEADVTYFVNYPFGIPGEEFTSVAANVIADPAVGNNYLRVDFTITDPTVAYFAIGNPFEVRIELEFGETEPDPLNFELQVKPGDDEEDLIINSKSKGVTPFVLLGTSSDFDPTAIIPSGLIVNNSLDMITEGASIMTRGKGDKERLQYAIEDVNEDGIDDFVFKVSTPELFGQVGSIGETELFVHGMLGESAFTIGGVSAEFI